MGTTSDEKYIDDFGEKIGGARKDLWKERNLSISDISSMTSKEISKFVTKDSIWKEPELDFMLDSGMPDSIVLFIYEVYNSISLKAKITLNMSDNEIRESALMYIKMVEHIRDSCKEIKENSDVPTFVESIVELDGLYKYGKQVSLSNLGNKSGLTQRFARLCTRALRDGYLDDYVKIQNFPYDYNKNLREVFIRHTTNAYYIYNGTTRAEIKDLNADINERNRSSLTPCFNTLDDAIAYVRDEYTQYLNAEEDINSKKKDKSIKKKIVRPQLEVISRIGPNLRRGADVDGDIMQKVFCIRAGEFGKWNNQEDRQACLNYSFDALNDLAFALGIKTEALCLDEETYKKM